MRFTYDARPLPGLKRTLSAVFDRPCPWLVSLSTASISRYRWPLDLAAGLRLAHQR